MVSMELSDLGDRANRTSFKKEEKPFKKDGGKSFGKDAKSFDKDGFDKKKKKKW
jgi:hypothetical protein